MNNKTDLLKQIITSPVRLLKKMCKLFHRKKNILIYSYSTTTDEHIMKYYDAIKSENYKIKFIFWVVNKLDKTRYAKLGLNKKQVITNKIQFWLHNPDLIIIADLGLNYARLFSAKTIYVNHGASTVSWNNSIYTCYSYNREKPNFDLYFETNKLVYDKFKDLKNYENHLVFAGNKYSDEFRKQILNKEKFKKDFNIKANQKVVFLIGSWKSSSLFHKLGKDIFDELKRLAKNEKYKFMVSIHPNEYRNYSKVTEPFGKYVDELANFGIIVRKPGTDMMPYLYASDIVISDFSSMTENAVMAEKDIIFSEFDDNLLFAYSSAYRLKKIVPILSKASDLENIIKQPYPKEIKKEILKIKAEMETPEGFYAELCKKTTKELLNKQG